MSHTDRVAAQLPAGVFCLAVGALVETAGVDGNDLHQRVFPDLGQQQRRTAELLPRVLLLTVQPDCVTWRKEKSGQVTVKSQSRI